MPMRIIIKRNDAEIAEDAEIADTTTRRLIGLIGRMDMPRGTAFVLPGCRQVHTFFMRFPIDLIYVDRDWRVLRTRRCIPPWRFGPYCPNAAYAIELRSGTISAAAIEVGDQLQACE